DAFAASVLRPPSGLEVLVASLADGAGSAERADAGARLATSVSVEVVVEALADGAAGVKDAPALLRFAAEQARLAVAALAGHEEQDVADFASTLLVALLHAEGGAIGQIGDGAVVARNGSGVWQPILWPDHGEYVNTTRFLTDPDGLDHLRVEDIPGCVESICLFSDGLERLVLDLRARTAHAPFFDAVFRRFGDDPQPGHASRISRELTALLGSDAVNSRTDDDKSILCATLLRRGNGADRSAQG
ncbi:MAG TPA: PP2C family serine/threonine-protein phosphatase, partial [Hyphomicrobiaceae bacterium]